VAVVLIGASVPPVPPLPTHEADHVTLIVTLKTLPGWPADGCV
jgi:hypothetical protein